MGKVPLWRTGALGSRGNRGQTDRFLLEEIQHFITIAEEKLVDMEGSLFRWTARERVREAEGEKKRGR